MPLKESEIAERIREEHERIKQQMKKINTMINAHVSQEGFPKWRLDFLWLLRDFKNDLHKHFDLEEEGGFMTEVVSLAPQHLNVVRQLEDEHQAMIASMDEILTALKSRAQKDDLKLDNLRRQITDLFGVLEKHEIAEGDLIESTYLQDDGMAD
jgi:hypothetical protein